MLPTGSRRDELDAPLKTYLCAVGAAIAGTVFDGMQNEEAAALRKATRWFANALSDGVTTPGWSLAAIAFFAAVAALLVLAYKPKATREAFMLGLGVLALLNTSIRDPGKAKLAAGGPIAAAHAQPVAQGSAATEVWLFVNGPSAVNSSDIGLTAYPQDRQGAAIRRQIRPIDTVQLPPGRYVFELSHSGFRTISFSAEVKSEPMAITRLFMRDTQFDSFVNVFGAERAKPSLDVRLAQAVVLARELCARGDKAGANRAIAGVRPEDRMKLENDEFGRRIHCADALQRAR